MNTHRKVRTCLWFESGGEEAARFYITLLPDSRIESSYHTEPDEAPLVVNFTLGGAPYQILNGGPEFSPSPAASISVVTEDQAETDRLWEALTADGEKEGRCGWLTDRWGVSWQICPRALIESLMSEDRSAAGRAFQAMLTMNRIDVAGIEAAFRDDGTMRVARSAGRKGTGAAPGQPVNKRPKTAMSTVIRRA